MKFENNYKLSAIVLVYNSEKYLRPLLNSLVNQTLDNMEIILVNDASTDDSLSICREYEMEYPHVKIINKKENEGLSVTANIGIEAAKGEYIILVDNDDIVPSYMKNYITKQKRLMRMLLQVKQI
ncbi:MAG: glycosyltransferase [Methanobacterium sp.]|nr:glycosyltransferase [Methanobacterium sp.]